MNFTWTCEICKYNASTEADRDAHKASEETVHTPQQRIAAAEAMHAQLLDVVKKYLPSDIHIESVEDRVGILKGLIGTSRTSALGSLVNGAISAAMTGLTYEQAVYLVRDLYDLSRSSEIVRDFSDKYQYANEQYKLQAAGKLIVPSDSGVKH